MPESDARSVHSTMSKAAQVFQIGSKEVKGFCFLFFCFLFFSTVKVAIILIIRLFAIRVGVCRKDRLAENW